VQKTLRQILKFEPLVGLWTQLSGRYKTILNFNEMKTSDENLRHFEFLANNSKEIIEKQVDSYMHQRAYAGTILGYIVLFIPFFFKSVEGSNQTLRFIFILPVVLYIGSILLMLSVFRGKPVNQALSVTKYNQLLTKSYKEILLLEIEANKVSYIKNNVTDLRNIFKITSAKPPRFCENKIIRYQFIFVQKDKPRRFNF